MKLADMLRVAYEQDFVLKGGKKYRLKVWRDR